MFNVSNLWKSMIEDDYREPIAITEALSKTIVIIVFLPVFVFVLVYVHVSIGKIRKCYHNYKSKLIIPKEEERLYQLEMEERNKLEEWYKKHYIVSYINNFIPKPVMCN